VKKTVKFDESLESSIYSQSEPLEWESTTQDAVGLGTPIETPPLPSTPKIDTPTKRYVTKVTREEPVSTKTRSEVFQSSQEFKIS